MSDDGMRCLDYSKEIGEGVATLQAMYRKQSRSLARRRLRFLLLLKSGECASQALAGAKIGIKARAAEKLWALYRNKGIVGLLEKPHSGQPPKLTDKAKAVLQKQLDGNHLQTLRDACAFVLKQQGIMISQSAMHHYFKAQGIKKKTGRPTNVHKDVVGEEAFKKKSFPGSNSTMARPSTLKTRCAPAPVHNARAAGAEKPIVPFAT